MDGIIVSLTARREERAARQVWGDVLEAMRVRLAVYDLPPDYRARFGVASHRYVAPIDAGVVTVAAGLEPEVRNAAIARELGAIAQRRAAARAAACLPGAR